MQDSVFSLNASILRARWCFGEEKVEIRLRNDHLSYYFSMGVTIYLIPLADPKFTSGPGVPHYVQLTHASVSYTIGLHRAPMGGIESQRIRIQLRWYYCRSSVARDLAREHNNESPRCKANNEQSCSIVNFSIRRLAIRASINLEPISSNQKWKCQGYATVRRTRYWENLSHGRVYSTCSGRWSDYPAR